MTVVVSLLIGALGVVAAYLFSINRKEPERVPALAGALRSIVIPAYTTHARHLPKPSRHAFSYPLLYVGVDIDSLTSGALDLRGRLLSYGGSPWTKILGLRSDGYLRPGKGSLRAKVETLLAEHDIPTEEVDKVWLVTMPSFVGFEGINPLSVWYVYSADRQLRCVILEVHNTFGEKHAYVLKTDSQHRHDPAEGYDFAWTFPRSFHVSPFNSRNGYYRLDLVDPFPTDRHSDSLPGIKVFLKLLTPSKEAKLQALLASSPARPSIPIESRNWLPILLTLLRFPLALLLTTPRILYQAHRLHYEKDLAVYPRPEPKSDAAAEAWNAPQSDQDGLGVGIAWQQAGWGERTAQRILVGWCEARATELGVAIQLRFLDERPDISLGPDEQAGELLTITTADPRFFTNLLVAPTPCHYTILAPELLTSISDAELFVRFFEDRANRQRVPIFARLANYFRHSFFVFFLGHSDLAPGPDLWHHDERHFTASLATLDQFRLILVVMLAYTADVAEERIMRAMGATFVQGQEPWKLWERALRRQYEHVQAPPDTSAEDWTVVEADDLGSIRIDR